MFPVAAVVVALASLPDPLPDGAVCRLGSVRFCGPNTWGFSFSPDGRTLYAPAEKAAFAWDAETGKRLPDIPCPTAEPTDQIDSWLSAGGHVVRLCSPPPLGKKFSGLVVNSLTDGKESLRVRADGTTLVVSINQVNYLAAMSADGTRLAVAQPPDGVVVWDTSSGAKVTELGKGSFGPVALSADGSVVCTLHAGLIRVWDGATGEKRTEVKAGDSLRLFRVSPDGKRAAAHAVKPPEVVDGKPVPARAPDSLQAWDLDTGKELGRLPLDHRPYDLRFVGPDGVVAGVGESSDRQSRRLFRWNLTTAKREWETAFSPARRSDGPPWGWVAAHPGGKKFAVAGLGGPIALFDAMTGKRLNEPAGHSGPVRAIHFSADGSSVFTLSEGEQRTWDAVSGEAKGSAQPPAFSGTLTSVHAAAGIGVWPTKVKDGVEVVGWDVEKGKVAWRFTPDLKSVARVLSADGKRVLVLGGESSKPPLTFALYDGPTGKKTDEWSCPREVFQYNPMALSPDGGRLWVATAKGLRGYRVTDGGDLAEVAAEVGAGVRTSGEPTNRQIAVGLDGTRIATAGKGKGVSIITLAREVHTRQLNEVAVNPQAVVFSKDGKRVAAFEPRSSKAWVYDWDLPDDQMPRELDGGFGGATTAAFSPDGKRLAVGYADGTTVVWRLAK